MVKTTVTLGISSHLKKIEIDAASQSRCKYSLCYLLLVHAQCPDQFGSVMEQSNVGS